MKKDTLICMKLVNASVDQMLVFVTINKDVSVWNKDECRSECKDLIDKGVCDKVFIWNPSNCEC